MRFFRNALAVLGCIAASACAYSQGEVQTPMPEMGVLATTDVAVGAQINLYSTYLCTDLARYDEYLAVATQGEDTASKWMQDFAASGGSQICFYQQPYSGFVQRIIRPVVVDGSEWLVVEMVSDIPYTGLVAYMAVQKQLVRVVIVPIE
jgi:hypothetical protein